MNILSYHNVEVPATTAHSLYTVRTSADLSTRAPVTMIAARGRATLPFRALYPFQRSERPDFHLSVPPIRHKGVAGIWRRSLASRWLAKSAAPKVVYVTQARPLRHFATLKRRGKPPFILVVECHAVTEPWDDSLSSADGVMYTSAALRDEMIRRHPAAKSLPSLLSPHRIAALPREAPAADFRADPRPFVLGYVGSLLPWKGLEVLIDAAARLSPRFEVRIVGGDERDPYRKQLQERARAQGTGARVVFTPFVAPSRLPDIVSAMDAFALPLAAEEQGNSPMKLIEYLSWQRPVVASSLPSIREVLRHGENGLLFPPGDADGLARQVLALAARPPADRARMAGSGRETLRPFLRDAWLDRVFAWLDDLVRRTRP